MLELKDVSFAVKSGGSRVKILDRISLQIKPGVLTVITGPNGGGKSTLAQIIMGIKQPTSGKIFLDGEDITERAIADRAKLGVAFSFQQPVQFKGLTVYELLNIASGELISPEVAGKFLAQVGLTPMDYLPREVNNKLSGGELKRIEIATVLARKDTKIIIFDEPEAGIDLWSFQKLTSVFQKLHREHPERSLIIISHQEKILKIADQIIILKGGKVVTKGAPIEILSRIKEVA